MHWTGMASGQLSAIHQRGSTASKFTWPKTIMSGIRRWRPVTRSIQNPNQSPNSKKRCRWSGTACHRGSINKAINSFTLRLKRCTEAGDEQFKSTKWLSIIRQSVYCVVSVTLFCRLSPQTFFSAWVTYTCKITRWNSKQLLTKQQIILRSYFFAASDIVGMLYY